MMHNLIQDIFIYVVFAGLVAVWIEIKCQGGE
jgi:hypothetical protein